jgi:hypothetical protein
MGVWQPLTCQLIHFLSVVREKATEKIEYKYFRLFCSYFGLLPQTLSSMKTRTAFLFIPDESAFSTVQFTASVSLVPNFHATSEF